MRSSDVGAVDFLRESERVERLVRELLSRIQVHDHQRLRIAAQRVLEQVRQLKIGIRVKPRRWICTFEFLYGTCLLLLPSAAITSPSDESEPLIFFASSKRCPVAPDSFTRSEPRKLIRSHLFRSNVIAIQQVNNSFVKIN